MKPARFEYIRASNLQEAVEFLVSRGEDAKVLAGGQSLVAMMNMRLARPTALVDINGLPGLSYIIEDEDALKIGTLTRHQQIERYPGDLGGLTVLARSAALVGHLPIRTRGTFGGSIAHGDSVAEWCVLAVLLDAEMVAVGVGGSRVIPASSFFRGLFSTALEPAEILVEVRFPRRVHRAALCEFARRKGDFAVVAAAVAYDLAAGRISRPSVALGGVGDRPVRIHRAAATLEGEIPSVALFAEAAKAAAATIEPPTDLHGSSDYRRDLAAALIERALAEAQADD